MIHGMDSDSTRRPLKSRKTKWAASIARWLAGAGVRPNAISISSVLFAGLSGASFYLAGAAQELWQFSALCVLAAVFIQLRLLCNLMDGMVAVEGRFKTKSGEIYNELPDRFSDVLILGSAGYAIAEIERLPELGWLAAALAVTTAYVRALGVSAGARPQFIGPMAKPHRMATLTAACLVAALSPMWPAAKVALPVALALVAAGSLITIFRRACRIVRELQSR
jgi:phosphatidylglycerophosphate synthase